MRKGGHFKAFTEEKEESKKKQLSHSTGLRLCLVEIWLS